MSDVTSTSVSSNSAVLSSVAVATTASVSPSTVALPHSPSSSEQLPIAVDSSTPQQSSSPLAVAVGGSNHVDPSTQPPSVGSPLGSGSEVIIGAVVAVVVILIVVSVIVAALLIAWRVRRSGGKAFTGESST